MKTNEFIEKEVQEYRLETEKKKTKQKSNSSNIYCQGIQLASLENGFQKSGMILTLKK